MKKILVLILGLVMTAASCNLFGGSGAKGVFKSEDGGVSFSPANALEEKGEISGLSINSLTMDPQNPDIIYLGSHSGIHRTTDGAKTWKYILANMKVADVDVDPSQSMTLYATGITSQNGVIVKTDDGGTSWRDVYTEPTKNNPVLSLGISRANSKVLLAGLNNGEIIRSIDEGTTWQLVRDLSNPIISIEYTDNATAYALTQTQGLYISTDQGSNWNPIAVSTQAPCQPGTCSQQYTNTVQTFYSAAFDKRLDSVIFLATQQGLLRTVDGGVTWTTVSLPATNESLTVSAVAINPTNSNNLVIAVGSTFFRSTNGGVSWETRKLPTQQRVKEILINPDEPNEIYLGMGDF
jgi:photosystem II stability/assembly factor-like uncharacterized protein